MLVVFGLLGAVMGYLLRVVGWVGLATKQMVALLHCRWFGSEDWNVMLASILAGHRNVALSMVWQCIGLTTSA